MFLLSSPCVPRTDLYSFGSVVDRIPTLQLMSAPISISYFGSPFEFVGMRANIDVSVWVNSWCSLVSTGW